MLAKLGTTAIDDFEFLLAESIAEMTLAERHWGLGVGYAPDNTLVDAAEGAGIKLTFMMLPCNTYMKLMGDKVTVACGRGIAWEEI